ncbi:hypothetical protein Droror1_Dr00025402, partial [Drosera rotundifolia]
SLFSSRCASRPPPERFSHCELVRREDLGDKEFGDFTGVARCDFWKGSGVTGEQARMAAPALGVLERARRNRDRSFLVAGLQSSPGKMVVFGVFSGGRPPPERFSHCELVRREDLGDKEFGDFTGVARCDFWKGSGVTGEQARMAAPALGVLERARRNRDRSFLVAGLQSSPGKMVVFGVFSGGWLMNSR